MIILWVDFFYAEFNCFLTDLCWRKNYHIFYIFPQLSLQKTIASEEDQVIQFVHMDKKMFQGISMP